jgi:hypothetical protein
MKRRRPQPRPQVTDVLIRIHRATELAGGKDVYVSLTEIYQYKDKVRLQFIGYPRINNLVKLGYMSREGHKYKVTRPIPAELVTA